MATAAKQDEQHVVLQSYIPSALAERVKQLAEQELLSARLPRRTEFDGPPPDDLEERQRQRRANFQRRDAQRRSRTI